MHRPTRIIGTRGSALALWQAHHVRDVLTAAGYPVEIRTITTKGDRILDVPLAEIGSKALFTKELDEALLRGEIHLAVHSLKDLPTALPEGLCLAAITERADPRDAFIAHPSVAGGLADLPEGATLATSSLRRRAQLKAWRPDLTIVPVRGNVDTRLARLDAGTWHGMILATAGVVRLERTDRIRERIDPALMLPAVGQGALGVVCAVDDEATRALLRRHLHHAPTAAATLAERALLRRLEGGCQVPIGALGRLREGRLELEGCVASLDGDRLVRDRLTGTPGAPEALGGALAERLLAAGAGALLDEIRADS